MSCYFIARIRIKDEKEYSKYLERSDQIFNKYKGKYLSVDNNPEVLEGNWNYTRSILIEFDRKEDFYAWYNSDEYREILRHRLNAADSDAILVSSGL